MSEQKLRWFRFSLRTLFAMVAVIGIAAAWVAYQLNWIRQRHEMCDRYLCHDTSPPTEPEAPWPLRLFGEFGFPAIDVPPSKYLEAKALFPEAVITARDILEMPIH